MKRLIALRLLLALLLALGPVAPAFAQSGGNCSVFRTWNTGDSVTAGDLNSSFSQAAVTNGTLDCVDGYSDSLANMQSTTNPWTSADATSAATNARGEIERLRFILQDVFGWANWYRRDTSVDFATGVNIDGSGLGRHVTAVGFHAWSGFSSGIGASQFPAITSVADHQTGFLFPLAEHVVLAIRDNNVGGGAKGGIPTYRWHAYGMTLHHTAALRFAHSQAQMGNGQYGHVTALRVTARPPSTNEASGLNNSFGFTEGNDQIIVGHAGSALRLEGASITEGSNKLLGYGSGNYVELKTISGSLTITHQAGQIVFGGGSAIAAWASRGQFSGTGFGTDGGHIVTLRAHIVQLMNAASHAVTIRVSPADIAVDLNDNTSGNNNGATPNGRDRKQTFEVSGVGGVTNFVHVYWIWHASGSLLRGVMSPNAPTSGPNLPTGFTDWAYAGTYLRSTTNITGLVAMHVMGNLAQYSARQNALENGLATTATTVDLSTLVPTVALATILHISVGAGNVIRPSIQILQGLTAATAIVRTVLLAGGQPTNGSGGNSQEIVVPNISERIFYLEDNAVSDEIDVKGYYLPNGG